MCPLWLCKAAGVDPRGLAEAIKAVGVKPTSLCRFLGLKKKTPLIVCFLSFSCLFTRVGSSDSWTTIEISETVSFYDKANEYGSFFVWHVACHFLCHVLLETDPLL